MKNANRKPLMLLEIANRKEKRMKTLDEVIVELESYPVVVGTTLTFDVIVVPERSLNDALHYLKEYREKHDDILRMEEALGYCEIMDNPPLTMEYFSKQIDTEPIWCEKLGEWYLFLAYDDGENEIQLMSDKGDIETFDEEDLEKYPLYRRK